MRNICPCGCGLTTKEGNVWINGRHNGILNKGKRNPNWKGDEVGLQGLHNWVRRRKPKPILCEKCKKRKAYDLANISGKYKRDVNDFEWLCRKCHMKEDNRIKNLKKGNGSGKNNPCWKGGKPDCEDCGKKLSNYNNKRCNSCVIKKFKEIAKTRKRDSKGKFI